jgi:NAD(P)-dependent dehydrogenase (short-subunit alcohol dehydrogenase family)
MSLRFENKVAIVTGAGCVGAGWGNGRAIAVRLAEEGAKVLAIDRDRARLDETLDLAGDARASITPWVCGRHEQRERLAWNSDWKRSS